MIDSITSLDQVNRFDCTGLSAVSPGIFRVSSSIFLPPSSSRKTFNRDLLMQIPNSYLLGQKILGECNCNAVTWNTPGEPDIANG